MKTKKTKKKVSKKAKKATKKAAKKPKKVYEHGPDHFNTSEPYLINPLDEDLKDAWFKIREFGASLGDEKTQRIYASGRAIMFSKKVCYFFVRPQKSYLEVVIFLSEPREDEFFRAVKAVSKTKYSHTFRLVHADQVEGELTEAIRQAFTETPTA